MTDPKQIVDPYARAKDTTYTFDIAVMSSGRPLLENTNSVYRAREASFPRFTLNNIRFSYGGIYLHFGRSEIVQWFLNESDSDFLLWVDDDVLFTPEDIDTLTNEAIIRGSHFASGTYANINADYGLICCAYNLTSDPEAKGQQLSDGRRLVPIPEADTPACCTEVDAVGFGFVLTSRFLLAHMLETFGRAAPWFGPDFLAGPDDNPYVQIGEDFSFCTRASRLGHRPLLVPTPGVAHYKYVPLRLPFQLAHIDDVSS